MRRTAWSGAWEAGWTWQPPPAGTPRYSAVCHCWAPSASGSLTVAASGGPTCRSQCPPGPQWRWRGRPWPCCIPGRGEWRCTDSAPVNASFPPQSSAPAEEASQPASASLSHSSASSDDGAFWFRLQWDPPESFWKMRVHETVIIF